VAQAASWHLANDLSWEQIAGLVRRRPAGLSEPIFRPEDVRRARSLVESDGVRQLANHAPSKAR
jgi:hypothetical protein